MHYGSVHVILWHIHRKVAVWCVVQWKKPCQLRGVHLINEWLRKSITVLNWNFLLCIMKVKWIIKSQNFLLTSSLQITKVFLSLFSTSSVLWSYRHVLNWVIQQQLSKFLLTCEEPLPHQALKSTAPYGRKQGGRDEREYPIHFTWKLNTNSKLI